MIFILLIVSFLIYYFYTRKDVAYKIKNVLSKTECEEFISMANKNEFLVTPDPVDNKPVYQIEILDPDKTVNHPELYFKCLELYKRRLPKQKGELNYIFLKRYAPGERSNIPMHVDLSKSTINILLSNPKDYTGGQFYLFEDPKDLRARRVHDLSTIESKHNTLKNMEDLPVVYMKQGDMINYQGRIYDHGVLPVTSGVRYVLTFFFDHI